MERKGLLMFTLCWWDQGDTQKGLDLGKGHPIPSPLWGGEEEKEGTGKGSQRVEGRNKVVRREVGSQGWCQDSFLPQLPGHPLWADIVQGAWDPDMVPSRRV